MADLFAGKALYRNGADENKVDAAELKGKIVAIYFSAHWCPPCRGFTPVLKEFYDKLAGTGEFEIVFASGDQSDEELKEYLKESHGAWLYLPYEDPLVEELSGKYEVEGIPTLVVVKADGSVITKEGRKDVVKKSPSEALAAWKSA